MSNPKLSFLLSPYCEECTGMSVKAQAQGDTSQCI